MAKKKINPHTYRHMKQDILIIFERIDAELFANEYLEIAYQMQCKEKLLKLQCELIKLKEALIIESINRNDDFAYNTAYELNKTLNEFFFRSEPDQKRKVANHFFNVARNAWFSRRTKTIIIGVVGGIIVFGASLALIIATGGLALMGIGAVLGISFLLGALSGGAFAFGGYKLSLNEHETRGQGVKNALMELNDEIGLPMFITNRNDLLNTRSDSALVKEIKEKYFSNKPKKDDTKKVQPLVDTQPTVLSRLGENATRVGQNVMNFFTYFSKTKTTTEAHDQKSPEILPVQPSQQNIQPGSRTTIPTLQRNTQPFVQTPVPPPQQTIQPPSRAEVRYLNPSFLGNVPVGNNHEKPNLDTEFSFKRRWGQGQQKK